MRLAFFALFTLFYSFAFPAHAQEAGDAQRLHDAAFAERPSNYTWNIQAAPYSTVTVGRFTVEPSYSLKRTAEEWRVPESGQDMTTSQLAFRAYAADHPIVKFGATLFMRSGHHADSFDTHDPSSMAQRVGHEPNEKKFMFNLAWLFAHKD